MNMILKKQMASGRGHSGFTLVEVIVVLVILAILAAIAIPALTGYIDKAEDKKYIADARNTVVAMRTILDEAYADGKIGSSADATAYFNHGGAVAGSKIKVFAPFYISYYVTNDFHTYHKEANKLMGIGAFKPGKGEWSLRFAAPTPSAVTMRDASAFYYLYYMDGNDSGKNFRIVIVTYNIDGIPSDTDTFTEFTNKFDTVAECKQSVGYKVYHVIQD
jgi:prepilin-type N-terminal cleavage/methylation domain-containing protein